MHILHAVVHFCIPPRCRTIYIFREPTFLHCRYCSTRVTRNCCVFYAGCPESWRCKRHEMFDRSFIPSRRAVNRERGKERKRHRFAHRCRQMRAYISRTPCYSLICRKPRSVMVNRERDFAIFLPLVQFLRFPWLFPPAILPPLLFVLAPYFRGSRMSNGDQFGSLARANLEKAEWVCQARRGDSSKHISADDENERDGGTGSWGRDSRD